MTSENQNNENPDRDWTVMIYLAGDNNLSEEMIYAIKEMYRVGVTKEFDVIMQFDPSGIGAPVRSHVISADISQQEIATKAALKELVAAGKLKKQVVDQLIADGVLEQQLVKSGQLAINVTEPEVGGLLENNVVKQLIKDGQLNPTVVQQLKQDGKLETMARAPVQDEDGRLRIKTHESSVGALQTAPVAHTPRSRNTKLRRPFENSADPEVLKEFISSGIRSPHRAKHYMVILSGHGSGAEGDFLTDDGRADSLPREDGPSISSLSIPSLGWVLAHVKKELEELTNHENTKLDILGMDSCLMSTVEVCYEVRKYVKFLVGAEGFELNTGWPYHRILEMLRRTRDEATVASQIVQDYIRYYTDYEVAGVSTDQAACDLESFDKRLVPAIRGLAKELNSGLTYRIVKDAILLAHWESQSYKREQYVDLFDFCDQLQMRCADEHHVLNALKETNDIRAAGEVIGNQLDFKHRDVLEALESLNKEDHGQAQRLLSNEAVPEEVKDALQATKTEKSYKSSSERAPVDEQQVKEKLQLIIDQLDKLGQACQDVKGSIQNDVVIAGKVQEPRVVVNSGYSGPAFQHSHGLSVYFPWFEEKDVLDRYERLGFAKDVCIVMQEEATAAQIQAVEETLKAMNVATYRSTQGIRNTLGVVEGKDIDSSKIEGLHGVSQVEGTGWATFLRNYLQTTRRARRNQKANLGKVPIRIDPPKSAFLPLPVALRTPPGDPFRGFDFTVGTMKNPPDGFYRDDANT